MKIKLTSLLLLVVMLFSVLTLASCGDDDQELTEEVKAPITITLYSIKEEGTTDEAIALVEERLNLISRAYYNTAIKLVLYTEAEYDTKLAEKMAAAKANPPAQKKPSTQKNPTYETTVVDGFEQYIYPTATDSQLDVFLVRDQGSFNTFVADKSLSNLTDILKQDNFLTLSGYINKYLMSAVTVNNSTYAVPNNHLIASYTYLLLNKEMVEALGYTDSYGEFDSLYDLRNYLADVDAAYPDATPLFNCPEASVAFIEEGSMIGTLVTDDRYLDANMPVALLKEAEYAQYLASKQAYEQLGYLKYDESFDGSSLCGAAFVSSMPGVAEELYGDDYYTILYALPMATNEALYSSMYAISAHSVNAERAMEVISLLNTNEEFRNIFQYGVEGTHFTRDEYTGLVHRENRNYLMNDLYTGNGYLLYPNDEMTENELDLRDERTYEQVKEILGDACKEQKWVGERTQALLKSLNNAVLTSPYHGFAVNYDRDKTGATKAAMENAKEFSQTEIAKIEKNTFEKYLTSNPDADGLDYIEFLTEKYQSLGNISAQRFILLTGDGDSNTPASQFKVWYMRNNPTLIYRPKEETPAA